MIDKFMNKMILWGKAICVWMVILGVLYTFSGGLNCKSNFCKKCAKKIEKLEKKSRK